MRRHFQEKAGLFLSIHFIILLLVQGFYGPPAYADEASSAPSIDRIEFQPLTPSTPEPAADLIFDGLGKGGHLSNAVGKPRWIDLDDPRKTIYLREKNYNGVRQFSLKSNWILLLPGQKRFLGSLDGKCAALYSYPDCQKLKSYPPLPLGGLGTCDSSGNLAVFTRGNWKVGYDPQGHASNTAYCLNLKTGTSLGFALMEAGGRKYLLKIQTQRDYDQEGDEPVPSPYQGQTQPKKLDWLAGRVDLQTLQHEDMNQPGDPAAQKLSDDFVGNDRNLYPSIVLAPPGAKGLWIGFLSRSSPIPSTAPHTGSLKLDWIGDQSYVEDTTTFVYVDEELQARKICVLDGRASYFNGNCFVPSRKAFGFRDEEGENFLLRLPDVPSGDSFSYCRVPDDLNPPQAPADLKIDRVALKTDYYAVSRGFAAGPDGNFYHIENKNYPGVAAVIIRTNPEGFVLNTKSIPKVFFEDITLDNAGNIFATDGKGVDIFNSKCDPVLHFPNPKIDQKGPTHGGGEIRSLGVDGAGDIYTLTDHVFSNPDDGTPTGSNNTIKYSLVSKFSPKGQLLNNWYIEGDAQGVYGGCQIIKVHQDGSFYILSGSRGSLSRYDAKGHLQWRVMGYGTWDGEFMRPSHLAIDSAGNVFVSDESPTQIREFDPSGKCIARWDGKMPGRSFFSKGAVIAVDNKGSLVAPWTR